MNYQEFLKTKAAKIPSHGFDVKTDDLNKKMFQFQKDATRWALQKGRAALFEECGLGKTVQQLEWAHQIHLRYPESMILILAPLAVSSQTKSDGAKFGIEVHLVKDEQDLKPGINITNYEKLHKFNKEDFIAVVLDESSILKSFDGKMRKDIIDGFKNTPYRLACTATPAPNDYMELGNHAEFLGVMSRTEMLAKYFVHDGGDTSKWRLKGHAENVFWEWLSEWAIVLENPNDIGYDLQGFELPPLEMEQVITEVEFDGIFPEIAQTLAERRRARKESMHDRFDAIQTILENGDGSEWLIWCDYNYESELLKNSIPGSVEVKGADSYEHKETSMIAFSKREIPCLITKPSIAGFGMNWQNCHQMIFYGLSDSYEQFYQAIRRTWRFGQDHPVKVYVVMSEKEIATLHNINRKHDDALVMKSKMQKHSHKIFMKDITSTEKVEERYEPIERMVIPEWIYPF